MAYDIHIAANKHGFLVTGKQVGHAAEEQTVYRTIEDVMKGFRDTAIDVGTMKDIRRHLEDGKAYSVPNVQLTPDNVTHIFGT